MQLFKRAITFICAFALLWATSAAGQPTGPGVNYDPNCPGGTFTNVFGTVKCIDEVVVNGTRYSQASMSLNDFITWYNAWTTAHESNSYVVGSYAERSGTHCGKSPENPTVGHCACNSSESKADVANGSFCRPGCPDGQSWADGLAYGNIYNGGGTCATNYCVNTRDDGHTRLTARPSIACFPDMHRNYVDDFAMPTACHFLVGAGSGVVCALSAASSLTGIGLAVFAATCSGSASVVAAAFDLCPDYPW